MNSELGIIPQSLKKNLSKVKEEQKDMPSKSGHRSIYDSFTMPAVSTRLPASESAIGRDADAHAVAKL